MMHRARKPGAIPANRPAGVRPFSVAQLLANRCSACSKPGASYCDECRWRCCIDDARCHRSHYPREFAVSPDGGALRRSR